MTEERLWDSFKWENTLCKAIWYTPSVTYHEIQNVTEFGGTGWGHWPWKSPIRSLSRRHACAVLSHFSHIQLFATLWTVAHQTPQSIGILQASILEQVAMPSSRGSSQSMSNPSTTAPQVTFETKYPPPPPPPFQHYSFKLTVLATM